MPQLGVEKKEDLPLLIVCAIGPDGQYLQRSYPIDDFDEQTAYGSIESIVKIITDTVRDIAPENLSSTNVIREVKKNLDAELAKKQWKRMSLAMKELFKALLASGIAGTFNSGVY